MSKTDLIKIEKDWKLITTSGNKLVTEKTIVAITNYENALKKDEVLMENQMKCINFGIPVMPIFLISCNNLVQAYMVIGKWDMADKMAQRGLFYILHLCSQNLHPQASKKLCKWIVKQIALYKEFAFRSKQPTKFLELLKNLEKNENYCMLMLK
ncbi:MAG: hypothetical protein H0X63_11395 [Flavobacteriales bacterium]|jgi:hypothetical protein|nr:hypothetical protein [Flavobacteriales bacterium]